MSAKASNSGTVQVQNAQVRVPDSAVQRLGVSQNVDSDKDGVFDICDDCPSTPRGVATDAMGCPIPLYMKTNLTFASNEVAIDPYTQDKVLRIGRLLQNNPQSMAIVEGHTDDVGDETANTQLSQMRADTIKQLIIMQFNISPDRIKSMGYGESRPLVSNATESGRSRNRRVELTLTGYYRSDTSHIAMYRPYNIQYEPYQIDISGKFKERVDDLGAYLNEHPGTRAVIDGFTDNSGETHNNLVLSQKRANAIKDYLVEKFAITAERLTAIGHGENSPIASNDTENGRNINRRVTITVSRDQVPTPIAAGAPARFSGRLAGQGRIDTVSYTPITRHVNIRFKADNTDIDRSELGTINEIGLYLQKRPEMRVTIEGYTNIQGPQGRDVLLSRERAENIKRYLQTNYDISAERLRAIGYGADIPLADAGSTEDSVQIKIERF